MWPAPSPIHSSEHCQAPRFTFLRGSRYTSASRWVREINEVGSLMSKVDQLEQRGNLTTNKDLYREICKNNPDIALFSKDWWLDSVCVGGEWDATIYKKEGRIVSALPFFKKEKGPFKFQLMPMLTQNFKVWVNYPEGISESDKLDFELDAVKGAVDLLPKADYTSLNIFGKNANLLPFHWAGFEETRFYTYVVEGLSDLDEVLTRFDGAMRNKIRKADKIVSVKFLEDVSEFYAVNKKTFDRQGVAIPYSLEFIVRHDKALSENNSRKIFAAVDEEGRIHSALYLTWDSTSSYVHMVGEDPELRSSGAGIKLIWEAIKYTKETLNLDCFDYEGSMMQSVENVRRNCAGRQQQYSRMFKCRSRIVRAGLLLKDMAQ